MPALSHQSNQSQLSYLYAFYLPIAHHLTRQRHFALWTFIDLYWSFWQWSGLSCCDMAADQSSYASVAASQIIKILCVALPGLLARDWSLKRPLDSAIRCVLFSCWAKIVFLRACLFLWSLISLTQDYWFDLYYRRNCQIKNKYGWIVVLYLIYYYLIC